MEGCRYCVDNFYVGCFCIFSDYVWVVVNYFDACFVECWVVSAEIMWSAVLKVYVSNQC